MDQGSACDTQSSEPVRSAYVTLHIAIIYSLILYLSITKFAFQAASRTKH